MQSISDIIIILHVHIATKKFLFIGMNNNIAEAGVEE